MAHISPTTFAGATTVLTTDHVTGLPTLIALFADLEESLVRGTKLSLMIWSLDTPPSHRAPSNAAAHTLVRAVARVAQEAARAHAGARVYRVAADTFALVLPEMRRGVALQLAERLRLRLYHLDERAQATFAVASAPEDAAEVGALIAVCEVALLGDAQGRNCVHAATPVESLPPAMARLANVLVARMAALVEPFHLRDASERVLELAR